jgi:predicted nicotinamide N-methyase
VRADARRAFILENTRLQPPPATPELQLWLADEVTPLWQLTEAALQEAGLPPPFWAFAWPGGQALARYILDHPQEVAGRRVLDLATGSGIVAVAAMKAGAAEALAADVEPFCEAAVALNAAANGVAVGFTAEDLLGGEPPPFDVIAAADVSYEKPTADRVCAWLGRAAAKGARVLTADPYRTYFDPSGLEQLAEYEVATTTDLEDRDSKRAGVWTVGPARSAVEGGAPPL